MKLKVRNIITALILLLPALAYADVHTGIELKKEAPYDYSTQTGVIKLESFVGQVTKIINPNKSADVVLIVDGSSSMNRTTYSPPIYGMDDLYEAVGDFVEELQKGSTGSINHRVSIIIFAGNSKVLCGFTPVKDKEKNWFQELIVTNYRDANGHVNHYGSGTMAHIALGLASYIITGATTISSNVWNSTTYNPSGNNKNWNNAWILNGWTPTAETVARTRDVNGTVNRYVVFMTDGSLTGKPVNGDGSGSWKNLSRASGRDGNTEGEDQAVAIAQALKNDEATTIYSVGFLEDQDLTNGNNNYLNNVSSNHLSAPSGTFDSDNPADYIPHDYYIKVAKGGGGDLSSIFGNVSEEIVAGCAAIDLDPAKSEVTDVINDTYFKLPADINSVSNLLAHPKFKAYAVKCTNYEQTSTGPVYTFASDKVDYTAFATHPDFIGEELSFELTDGKSITVSGFNFSKHWCGLEYISTSKPKEPHGYKLVIEIPYTVKNYEGVHVEVPTNATNSGFSGQTTGGDDIFQAYGTPKISLFELTITRKGLRAGESAIYTIKDKDGKLLNTIVLTGKGGDVSQKVLYVPDGNIKVTETDWGWNNKTSSTNPQTYELSKTNTSQTYIFNGASSPGPGKQTNNPEDNKKNEFAK